MAYGRTTAAHTLPLGAQGCTSDVACGSPRSSATRFERMGYHAAWDTITHSQLGCCWLCRYVSLSRSAALLLACCLLHVVSCVLHVVSCALHVAWSMLHAPQLRRPQPQCGAAARADPGLTAAELVGLAKYRRHACLGSLLHRRVVVASHARCLYAASSAVAVGAPHPRHPRSPRPCRVCAEAEARMSPATAVFCCGSVRTLARSRLCGMHRMRLRAAASERVQAHSFS